jgi:catechol 2,3-dioxygenase-like lactoylglutathione lyase family enzyme
MKLGHLELFVADPRRSRDFYRDVLGFTVIAEQQQSTFIWLSLGDREILLRPAHGAPAPTTLSNYRQASSAIVIYTDDVPAEMARLQQRELLFRGDDGSPHCPTFADPDGHWFQLVNPEHP